MKKVRIYQAWCKGCGLCIYFCSKEVLELIDSECIVATDDKKLQFLTIASIKDIKRCNGCGICELYCPSFAIRMEEKK